MKAWIALAVLVAFAAMAWAYGRQRAARVRARVEARRERHRVRQQAWEEIIARAPAGDVAEHAP